MENKIDLITVHGFDSIHASQKFDSGAKATQFLMDYNFNQGKSTVVSKTSGVYKVFKCSSSNCKWEVKMSRKTPKSSSIFQVTHVHDFHNDQCISTIPKVSRRQLMLLKNFRNAVLADPASKISRLLKLSESLHSSSFGACKSTVYNAKDRILIEHQGDYHESFKKIESFLKKFRELNPYSIVALQKDEKGRFFRCFMSCGVLTRSQNSNQRILCFYGAPMVHDRYNGASLYLVGRDGNGQNVLLAFGIVSKESEENNLWFLKFCIASGIDFKNVPLFVDRGYCFTASNFLCNSYGYPLNLKHCTRHLIQSVIDTFKLNENDAQIGLLLWNIHKSEFLYEYESNLLKLDEKYMGVREYLSEIDPVYWVIGANRKHTCKEFGQSNTSRLYDWQTTKKMESENYASLQKNTPFLAIQTCAEVFLKQVYDRKDNVQKWLAENRTITPFAFDLISEQEKMKNEYRVQKSDVTNGVTTTCFVNHLSDSHKLRKIEFKIDELNKKSATCTCSTCDQFGVPCRHIIACIAALNTSEYFPMHNLVDSCYKLETYAVAYGNASVELPLYEHIISNGDMKIPPTYIQDGFLIGNNSKKRTNRYKSRCSIKTIKPKRISRCSICKSDSHNRISCRMYGNSDIENPTDNPVRSGLYVLGEEDFLRVGVQLRKENNVRNIEGTGYNEAIENEYDTFNNRTQIIIHCDTAEDANQIILAV